MIIGIHGRLASGKDTVLERMRHFDTRYTRVSFADKLKDSACALLGMSRGTMEVLKRDESHRLNWLHEDANGVREFTPGDNPPLTMRLFLQRYGTESHRGIFGDDFWVEQAMKEVDRVLSLETVDGTTLVPVFTDVRFANEAQAVLDRGGQVWRVVGADEDTGDHPSERPLPDSLISFTIDNSVRDDAFAALDRQIYRLITVKASIA